MEDPTPDLDAAATKHRTANAHGHIVWRAWGAGRPLILLHGGTGSWHHWAANIATYAATRFVLAPDAPGLGESSMPALSAMPQDVAAELAAGIDRLLGADAEYDICGFSYGSMLASLIAAAHGARVGQLTIVGPGALGLPRANVALEKVRSRTGRDRWEANRRNLGLFMLARPGRIDETAVAIQDWNTVHARFKSKDFAHTTAQRDAIAAAPARLHAIWGAQDVTAAPSVAARVEVVRAVRADARVTIIADAGHWVAWDAPEAFDAALLSG